jgi:hypothetical protein
MRSIVRNRKTGKANNRTYHAHIRSESVNLLLMEEHPDERQPSIARLRGCIFEQKHFDDVRSNPWSLCDRRFAAPGIHSVIPRPQPEMLLPKP